MAASYDWQKTHLHNSFCVSTSLSEVHLQSSKKNKTKFHLHIMYIPVYLTHSNHFCSVASQNCRLTKLNSEWFLEYTHISVPLLVHLVHICMQ